VHGSRLVVVAALCAIPSVAAANGRPPQIRNLYFRPGAEAEILGAATFGPIFSTDSGDTWRWMCESAVGYSGTYDPDYAVTPTGTAFATTFDGLRVRRPGSCVWDLSVFGVTFAANVAVASDGTVYDAIATPGDATAP
jgi:hypothetical protein